MGLGWGAGAKTLGIATLSLVYSTAEYYAPVWCCSAHTRLINSVLNDALCIVTGCLRPTPTDHLPVLSGIQPAELCQLGATLSLAYCGSLGPDHILYGTTLPDLASTLLNGQTTNGKQCIVKMLPGSMLLCLEPVPGLLGWAYPEQLGLSSTTCRLVLGDSIHP